MQVTDTILMVRPAAFDFNEETAVNNSFQNRSSLLKTDLQTKALSQFDGMVNTLIVKGVEVLVVNDTKEPPKPDAVFPNNWFSTNADGGLFVFPMFARNRRFEKRDDILLALKQKFRIEKFQDWTEYEAEAMYLERTGSMVMDHKNKIIYACLSPRTHHTLLEKFAATNGYRAIAFTAENEKAIPIYHTNVMMSVGDGFSVVCPKVIPDYTERIAVTQLLEATGHENIYIEPDLLKNFAANLLQVKNKNGNLFIAISKTAVDTFPKSKLNQLEKYGELLPIDVSVIEKVNGGSVRCMIAEIFLPPIN